MKKILNILSILFSSVTIVIAQPANNEPCGAINLSVDQTCNLQTYTTTGATLTTSPAISGCTGTATACISGPSIPTGDVWFTFTVNTTNPIYLITAPVSGGMNNPTMHIYTGDVCAGSGSIFTCIGNGLGNGNANFPDYVLSGLAVGTQVYIRIANEATGFFSCSATALGDFQICASTTVCGNAPMPGQSCTSATPICDLNGYCGRTTGYTVNTWTQLTNTFCSGIQNNSFLSFVASATSVTLNVNVSSCANGDGIQFLLFQTPTCESGSVTSFYCNAQMLPGITALSFTGLTPGQTYTLMVDGFSADVCNYTINIAGNGGILLPVNAGPDVSLCGTQTSVTLNVTGGGGPYTWTDSQGNNIGTGTSIVVNPTATETYTVTGTSGNPLCPNSTSDDVVVTVVPNNFAINVQPSDTTICNGSSLAITASGADSYVWSPATGLSGTTGSSVTANPSTSQIYTVTGTANGCQNSTTVNIHVNPSPVLPVISSNSPVCAGSNIQLNTTTANSTYHWSGPNSFNSTIQNPSIPNSATPNGGTYSLYVEENGCTSATQTMGVVVNPTPDEPVFTVSSPNCVGETITFDAPAYPTGFNYFWSGPNSWISSTQDPQVGPATTGMSGNYSLYIVAGGCTSITHAQNVLVSPKPTATYTGQNEVCGNVATLDVNAQVAAPDQIATYEWFHNSNSIGQAQTFTHTFNQAPTSTAVGGVEVTTEFGCKVLLPYSVIFNSEPIASFTFDPPCSGLGIDYQEHASWGSSNTNANFTYHWTFGDGQTSTSPDQIHTYLDNGTYSVTLIVGSSESICKDTITHQVKVSQNPEALISYEEKCFQNVSIQSSSITHGSPIENFDWDLGDMASSTDSSFIHEYDQPGTYNVSLTIITEEGCTSSVMVPIVVAPSTKLSDIVIPNIITANSDGVNDALILDQGLDECNEYEMQIFNRWGSVVYRQQKGTAPFSGRSQTGSKLTSGTYFYVIKADDLERRGTLTIAY